MRLTAALRPLLLAAALLLPSGARAQEMPPQEAAALRVFIDCSGFFCDMDYFQKEIAFVTHVRDRADADVHVLVTRQETGGGGGEYTAAFLGQRRFQGVNHTLRHVAAAGEAEDRIREGLAGRIKLGLVRYAAELPGGERLKVTYEAPQAAAAATPERDPWNYWTFRLSGNGYFSGEQSYNSLDMYGSVSANRTTEQWKIRLSVSGSNSRSEFELDSTQTIVNRTHSYGGSVLVARSLGPRLSLGARASVSSSSYLNQDLNVFVAPAIEYNAFPYSESTRRQLIVQYSIGPQAFDYEEETIFGRTSQTVVTQALVTGVVFKQPWGSVDVGLEGATYLHDLKKNRLELGGGVELNLFRGLSLEVQGSVERLRDQIYLAAGEASPEEILLRQRQLATGFQYFGFVGLSYTFGSRLSTVVNPRFNRSP